jgi:xylulose-5-phosphate/fructose-6-phosphate phosphoketolase
LISMTSRVRPSPAAPVFTNLKIQATRFPRSKKDAKMPSWRGDRKTCGSPIRVVNVVDLMKMQSASEHPHGLRETDYDALFTREKPIIFAFHGYPSLIYGLTYRRANRQLHVRGYMEEGTITTAFDMRVQNCIDRFHLVQDVLDNLPQQSTEGSYLKQVIQDKLIEHKIYIDKHGEDLPEVRNWRWGRPS